MAEEIKRHFWVSFALIDRQGRMGFGNSYLETKGAVFYPPDLQNSLARDAGAKACIFLYHKEVSEREYDTALARDVSRLEKKG